MTTLKLYGTAVLHPHQVENFIQNFKKKEEIEIKDGFSLADHVWACSYQGLSLYRQRTTRSYVIVEDSEHEEVMFRRLLGKLATRDLAYGRAADGDYIIITADRVSQRVSPEITDDNQACLSLSRARKVAKQILGEWYMLSNMKIRSYLLKKGTQGIYPALPDLAVSGSDLKFHISWDWLNHAVCALMNEGWAGEEMSGCRDLIRDAQDTLNIEDMYEAVVKYINVIGC